MSGICGWFGANQGALDQGSRLTGMAAGLGIGRLEKTVRASTDRAAFAAAGSSAAVLAKTDGPYIAAIEGYPRWLDADLARISARAGDAIAVIEGFHRLGRALPKALTGHCAFAVADTRADRLLIAIDRMATRTMCYAEPTADTLVFGATLDSVNAFEGGTPEIDLQSVFDFLYFGWIPAPKTIYRGRSKLMPAQFLWRERGRTEIGRYWSMPYEVRSERPAPDLMREVRASVGRAVGRTLEGADQRTLGAFLSGGIDSTSVVGLLASQTSATMPAFTIGFAEDGYDEMDYARISAAHFGARHVSYYVTPADVVEAVPRIAAAYDEPFGNASAIPVYYCAQRAAENGIKTMLAGDGGDEIFAGNPHYATQKLFERYHRAPAFLRRAILEPVINGFPGGGSIPLLRKARGYVRKANIPLPRRLYIDNAYENCDVTAIFARDAAYAIDPRHPMTVLNEVYQRTASDDVVQRLLHLDQQIILADNDLRKVSRMCELAGVAVRYPMLDEDVCELSASIPPEIALRGTDLRWFYKQAFKDFLPRQTIEKRKHGFGLPFGQWLRSSAQLRDFAYGALEPLKRRGFIRPDFIDRAIERHAEGHAAFHGATVWDLMMLSCWLEAHAAPAVRSVGATIPLTRPSLSVAR